MSLETLIAANVKATEDLTATLKLLVPALAGAVVPASTEAKPPKKTKPTAEPPATDTPATSVTTNSAPEIDDKTMGEGITALAVAGGRDVALAAINKFGGGERASNIKQIDRAAALVHFKAEETRCTAEKVAAAKAAAASASASLI